MFDFPPLRRFLWLGVFLLLASGCQIEHEEAMPWIAYYGSDAPAEAFRDYQLLIFDPDHHPDIAPLKRQGKKVLAYLSVGEIHASRSYASAFLSDTNFALKHDSKWDATIVDIRNPKWQDYIVHILLPDIEAQGFDGIFLDTLDAPLALEKEDAARYGGMGQALVQLVHHMRQASPPGQWMMVNRGFEILSDVSQDINAVLAESILVEGGGQGVTFFPSDIYLEHVRQLQEIRQKNPKIKLFSLDYLTHPDIDTVAKIICTQRMHGFSPYIGTPSLQEVQPAHSCS